MRGPWPLRNPSPSSPSTALRVTPGLPAGKLARTIRTIPATVEPPTSNSSNHRPSLRVLLARLVIAPLVVALLATGAGCSRNRFARAADREVYAIIRQAEQKVFGHTNSFSIDTQFSGRDPASFRPDEIVADRTTTNVLRLNLEQALDLAVVRSREYQTQREQLYLTALSLTGARYEFSPIFLANSAGTVSGSPSGTESGSVRTRVGVNQLLRTGGRLGVSLGNDLLRYFTGWSSSPGNTTRDSAINTLSVELSQPLLRGFGRNDSRVENLTQAERNVVYAVRTYSQYQHQFSVDIVNAWFSLLALKANVRNNYTNYLRRVDSTRYLEERSRDRVRKSDVDDARSSELGARIDYINSVASYLTSVASFKNRVGLPQSEEIYLDDTDLADLDAAGLIAFELDRTPAFRMAVENHMDLLNAIDRFEDTQRRVRIAADQLRPGLVATGGASLGSEPPYDYTRFNLDEIRYNAGVSLDLPVDRRRERNTYRAALVSFESQIRSLSLTLDNFKFRIDDGIRSLEQRRLNLLNRQAALEVASRRVELNNLLLQAGRANIRDLREAQDQLILAQNARVLTLVDYLRTRLQLMLDIGVLATETKRFWLVDPLAGRLTPENRGPSPLQMPEDSLLEPNRFLDPAP